MKPEVFLAPTKNNTEEDLKDAVKACFNQFGGIENYVRGNIFIKLNATAVNPDSITNPHVIYAIIKTIQEINCKKENIFIFDNSAFGTPTRLVFKIGNLAKKIKKLGAIPLYLDEQESISVELGIKTFDGAIPIPKIIYQNLIVHKTENTYINVPKLKTHLQTGITACLKNQHGLLYDDEKLYNHHKIDEKIVDIYEKFQPDLNIVDATSVVNNGAISFSKDWNFPLNLLLAGQDAVAVDRIGVELLGIPLERVKFLKLADERHLGCSKIEEIEILPNKLIIDKYKIDLNDMFEQIDWEMPGNFQILSGNEYRGCRAGCKSVLEYYKLIATGGKILPVIGICGRGQNLTELDKIKGSILVIGNCAITELKEYFENRTDQEKINVLYIDGHFPIAEVLKPFRKVTKISLKQLSIMLQLGLPKIITGMISAKLHKANFRNMIKF
ncbi:MAG: DUF362 domain-containing protein [Promethearchaeota archaeon]|jgi:uncharacterized protein (DUF362 family)